MIGRTTVLDSSLIGYLPLPTMYLSFALLSVCLSVCLGAWHDVQQLVGTAATICHLMLRLRSECLPDLAQTLCPLLVMPQSQRSHPALVE